MCNYTLRFSMANGGTPDFVRWKPAAAIRLHRQIRLAQASLRVASFKGPSSGNGLP
jgi:hypothetical protein